MLKRSRSIAAAVAVTAVVSAPAARAQQFINVLTGGTSGVYYPLGVAIGKIYSDKLPNVKTQVQATKASVENLILLQQGRGEIAFTLGDSLKAAWEGDAEAGFKTKLDKLRTIGAIYPNYIQIVATADSGIKTLADLKGKSLSVGAPKSGTELNSRAILAAAGLSYKDIGKVEYLPFAESVDLMKNRQLDATLQSAGLGVASLKDLSTSTDITVVSVPKRDRRQDRTAVRVGEDPRQYLYRPGQGCADRGRDELSRDQFGGLRRSRLPDDQIDLRVAAGTGECARGRQGDQAGDRSDRQSGAAASRRDPLLQGKGFDQVGAIGRHAPGSTAGDPRSTDAYSDRRRMADQVASGFERHDKDVAARRGTEMLQAKAPSARQGRIR